MPSLKLTLNALVVSMAASGMLAGCDKPAPPATTATAPIAVDVAVATPALEPRTTVLTGRLEAFRTAEVRARVAGIVEQRTYTEGAAVKAGELLFRIDPAPLAASLAAAEAELAQARVTAESAGDIARRSQQLVVDNSISVQQSRQDLFAEKRAQAAVLSAQAKVRSARLQLDYASVKSPIAGRARRALVSEGAMVGQDEGTPLTTVEQLDPIYVNFSQPASDFMALGQALKDSPGAARVSLRLGDGSLYKRTGKLLFSDTAVDPKTDTVALRALFDNPEQLLLPGLYVQVEFERAGGQHDVLIPQQALTRTRDGAYVMVFRDGHARQVNVQAQSLQGKQWRVSAGLAGGEQVILDGGALDDGQAVAAKPSADTGTVADRS